MAVMAHADAVAGSSIKSCFIFVFLTVNFFCFVAETHIAYGRNTFISIGGESAGFKIWASGFEAIPARGIFGPSNRTPGRRGRVYLGFKAALGWFPVAGKWNGQNGTQLAKQWEIWDCCAHIFIETCLHHKSWSTLWVDRVLSRQRAG